MEHTENYMWMPREHLGGGATGDVYKGYNKNTYEMVAVKVPRNNKRRGFEEYQQRELDVLRRFNHRNIVQLLAVETERYHGYEVIIMEYCNGGSLFSMLREPQNVFGLDDAEFITVLHDIAGGMEKLRKENVIHRDIKPGNIMRCIGLDGKTVYKLIDFDAARELPDEENFESIYGTEEYLHPQMYNRCFMDNYEASAFPHSVDLWSIGATLYHVATGTLPFTSSRGRKDRVTMSKIINGRGPKDISGVQNKPGGNIQYSQHLPRNVVMSLGLRPHVESIIALLFAKDTSFNHFFDAAKQICSLRRLAIFHYATTELLYQYLPSTTTYTDFQECLKKETGIPTEEQLLLYQNLLFSTEFSPNTGHLTIKETTNEDPIYLFSHSNIMQANTGLDNRNFNFPNVKNYKKLDDTLWQPCQESLQYILRAVITVIQRQTALSGGARMFIQHISRMFDRLENLKNHVSDLVQSQLSKMNSVQLLVGFVQKSHQSDSTSSGLDEYNKQMRSTKRIESKLITLKSNFTATLAQIRDLVESWLVDKPGCKPEDCCISQVKAWIREVDAMKNETRKTSIPEEEKLAKEKLNRAMNTCKKLVEQHCQPNSVNLYTDFRKFMIKAWGILEQLQGFENDLGAMMDGLKDLYEEGMKTDEERRDKLDIPSTLPSTINTTPSPIQPINPISRIIMGGQLNAESEFVRQLHSFASDSKMALLKELLPLAEENQALTLNINRSLVACMNKGLK